jgi:glutathione-specific gamma-glutamylcyclotransferase
MTGGDSWVFGYGSLMWRPGFAFLERRRARVFGWQRRLCVYSHHYRGTVEAPGLVMGLDRGGSCRGIAYRVAAAAVPAVRAYLDDREMIYSVYRARHLAARLLDGDGGTVEALTYVVDRGDRQYAGLLDDAARVAIAGRAAGASGTNRDYLASTVAHLADMGMPDRRIAALLARVEAADLPRPLATSVCPEE